MQTNQLTGANRTAAPGVQITLNIDRLAYNSKPQGAEVGALRNRLCGKDSITTVTPAELMAAVENGRTFTPGAMTGTSGTTWQQQQVIVADIDNNAAEPLNSDRAKVICNNYGIDPYFMYHTFSNGPQLEKYRIVIILDQPITDSAEAVNITAKLTGILNKAAAGCCDTKIADAARFVYGSTPGSIFYKSETITPLAIMRALPEVEEQSVTDPRREIKPAQPLTVSQRDFYDRRRADIEAFDLEAYILQTEPGARAKHSGAQTIINPCPVCGHNDDFAITGYLWQCFSESNATGINGGSIIDYLMARKGITKQEALEEFNGIMNYDIQPQTEPQEAETPADILTETGDDLEAFLEKIQTEIYKPHATGVTFIDQLLNGGVEAQTLNLIAAAPAAGKTALCSQIAESIARNGRPVIYFSFEMSREQMLARTISARLLKHRGYRKTPAEIRRGYNWSDADRKAITAEVEAYRQESRPRYVDATMVKPELKAIAESLEASAQAAIERGEEAPAVFVDYLHLVAGGNKDNVQENIKAICIVLKTYAIKYNAFVFAILAINRDSMKDGKITLYSGRDSSNIEYSADSFISLNYEPVETGNIKINDLEAMEDYRTKDKWTMILRALKDRSGGQAKAQRVIFEPAAMTFYGADNGRQQAFDTSNITYI